ncbi:hypothetical protein ACP70R_031193 [Stipagrostis hirtigluma subsp. patula]
MAIPKRRTPSGRPDLSPPPPPPPPHPHPPPPMQSYQSGGEEIAQETGTTKNNARANWNHQMKLFLVGLLKDHDLPRYRTQNAWSKEAWSSIVVQFNQKFSLSYTAAQVKQKEQDLKKEYRVVKDLLAESGFGWDPDRKMVVAPDSVWKPLESRRNKDVLLQWRDKSFPYFDDLFALYDGRYAQGRSCHGMDHYANKAKVPSEALAPPLLQVPEAPLNSPSPTTPAAAGASSLNFEVEGSRDDTNWFGNDAFSPFSTQDKDGTFHASLKGANVSIFSNQETLVPERHADSLRPPFPPSSSTPEVGDAKRGKRPKTSTTISTNEFQERYLKLKKEEIDRFAAIEEQKMKQKEDPYSIKQCVKTVEGLAGLQLEDMVKAADIFKDNPSNREVFLSFSSDDLRLAWLLKQI